MAFSPDGKLLASVDAFDGTVRLWNPATGRPTSAPPQPCAGYGMYGVTFSPDGKLLAIACADGTIRLWNPVAGQPAAAPIQVTTPLNGVHGVAFSPGGTLLASAGGDGRVRLWNPGHRPPHRCAAPDRLRQ